MSLKLGYFRRQLHDSFGKRSSKKCPLEAPDIDRVISHVTGIPTSSLVINVDQILELSDRSLICDLLDQMNAGKPLAYVLGHSWFRDYCFDLNSSVLIPRPETELLVDEALKVCAPGKEILDIGTGSGCIAISLALEAEPGVRVSGWDISEDALYLAKKNAERLGANINWENVDIFEEMKPGILFDIIVSNPPYIASSKIESLDVQVKDFEPRAALDGGVSGLDFYRRIVALSETILSPGGWLLFEIGFDQGSSVKNLLVDLGFQNTRVVEDYSRLPRIVLGQREID